MSRRKIGIVAGSVVAAGAIIAGGAAIATAADTPTPSASPLGGPARDGRGPGPGHQHTAATADQTAKVTAAVKAKDAAVTVTEVVKDADGSFDARGTKAGAPVHFDVSADYRTVTEGRPGGPGGPGRPMGSAVSGAELARVTAAVKAKDAAVTVTEVRKSPDGAYHAFGTKAGARVMVDLSQDLKTITVRTGGPGMGHGPGGPGGVVHTPVTGAEAARVTAAVKGKDSAVTVTSVRKDTDGSYDALGTRAGTDVMVEVSKDLKTVTVRTGGPGGPGGPGHGGPGGPPPGVPAPAPSATTS